MMREEEGDEKDPHRDQEEGVDPEIQEIREVEAAGEEAAAVGAEEERRERRERTTTMM